jgi:signal transduction histidine kinase
LTRDFAHDINNPLQIILGKAQILAMRMKKEGINKKYIEEMESIEKNAQRISCLIKKLSDFAKRGEDDIVSSSDVNLNHLLERTFLLVKNKFKSKGIDFQIKSQEKLPSVKGNPSQLEQVLLDLFLNAQRSMPQGGTLTVNLKKEKDFLELDFADTGEKISEEPLPKVFDPLYLNPDFKKRLPSGFLLSHQIVRDHKGEMEVLSNKGKGNIFRLKLPVIK